MIRHWYMAKARVRGCWLNGCVFAEERLVVLTLALIFAVVGMWDPDRARRAMLRGLE